MTRTHDRRRRRKGNNWPQEQWRRQGLSPRTDSVGKSKNVKERVPPELSRRSKSKASSDGARPFGGGGREARWLDGHGRGRLRKQDGDWKGAGRRSCEHGGGEASAACVTRDHKGKLGEAGLVRPGWVGGRGAQTSADMHGRAGAGQRAQARHLG